MAEQVIKKAPLRLLESVLKPKLIIPIEVSKKKDYLCTIIPDVEWSGILFYKVEGDLDKVESLVFTAVDIHPMDKGTGTATTYKFDSSEVVDIFADKPELMDCRFGHVHSHNKMGVFFSGTDNDELRDNAPNHNIYLSLIVNNAGDTLAKIAILSKLVIESKQIISFKGILGKLFNMEVPENKEEEVILTFTLDIEEEKTPLIEDTIFMDRVKEIITPKKFVSTTPGFKQTFPTAPIDGVYKAKSQLKKNSFDDGFVSDSDAIDFIHSTIGLDTINNKPLLYILRENLVNLDTEVRGSQLDAADYVETMFMGDIAEVFDPFCDGYWNDTVEDNAKIRRIILKAVSLLRPMSTISIVNSLINMYTKMANNDFIEVKRWKGRGTYNGR